MRKLFLPHGHNMLRFQFIPKILIPTVSGASSRCFSLPEREKVVLASWEQSLDRRGIPATLAESLVVVRLIVHI